MFTSNFVLRMAEQAVVTFLLSFGAVATATDGGFTRAAIMGGLTAGVRAVYGLFASSVGDPEVPSKF